LHSDRGQSPGEQQTANHAKHLANIAAAAGFTAIAGAGRAGPQLTSRLAMGLWAIRKGHGEERDST
jgi:hypothetical protein